MTLIVETGEGVSGANSYAGVSYALQYLTARNKATSWIAASLFARQAALIEATTYIDLMFGRLFSGHREFREIEKFARGFITISALPSADDTVTIGTDVFTFKALKSVAGEVTIGATVAQSMSNLSAEINAVSSVVDAALSDAGTAIVLTAVTSGEAANSIVTTTSNSIAIKIDTPSLTGGTVPGTQPLEFPRLRLYDGSGVLVDGIPEKLKQATVEYANRALAAALLPDPQYDSSGAILTQSFVRVGPIEEEKTLLPNAFVITRKYPMADRLLSEYTGGYGGVSR